jgi:hypothetical protein
MLWNPCRTSGVVWRAGVPGLNREPAHHWWGRATDCGASFMLRCEDPVRYAYGGQLPPAHTMAFAATNAVQRLVNRGVAVDGGVAAVLGAMAGTIGTQVRAQDTAALMHWRRQMRREANAEFPAFSVELATPDVRPIPVRG